MYVINQIVYARKNNEKDEVYEVQKELLSLATFKNPDF